MALVAPMRTASAHRARNRTRHQVRPARSPKGRTGT